MMVNSNGHLTSSGSMELGGEATLAEALEAFIRERFRIRSTDTRFSRDVNLWEEGYVDSAGVVEVVAFLEEYVGQRLPDELLFEPDFTTIAGMARHVSALET